MKVKNIRKVLDEDGEGGGDAGTGGIDQSAGNVSGDSSQTTVDTGIGMTTGNVGSNHHHYPLYGLNYPMAIGGWLPAYRMGLPYGPMMGHDSTIHRSTRRRKSKKNKK